MKKIILPGLFILVALMAFEYNTMAQDAGNRAYSIADYERAEKAMGYNTTQLVDHFSLQPNWLPDDHFWYRTFKIGRAHV